MTATLILFMHILAWFTLAALVTVVRGLNGTMKITTATALGFISFILHMIILKLYF